MRAFALMRAPEDLEATFRSSPFYARNRPDIETLRSATPAGLATRYRGIARFPFTEYAQRGPGWQGEDPDYDDAETRARELLLSCLGPDDHTTPYPRAFLDEFHDPFSETRRLVGDRPLRTTANRPPDRSPASARRSVT